MDKFIDRGIFLCSSSPNSQDIGNEGLLLSDGDAFESTSDRFATPPLEEVEDKS